MVSQKSQSEIMETGAAQEPEGGKYVPNIGQRALVYKEDICICAEWSNYINDPTRTRPDNRNTIAEHLFVNNICNVKCVGTDTRSLPVKMEIKVKYEEGEKMVECEWSRKILVAKRRGQGQGGAQQGRGGGHRHQGGAGARGHGDG